MRISDWSSDVCSSDLALTLVPICPHTLSDRSIVVNGKQTVRITLRGAPNTVAMLTCDGQTAETLHAGESFEVSRSEEHTSELQSLMRISYAVFCLKKKTCSTSHHTAHSKQIATQLL